MLLDEVDLVFDLSVVEDVRLLRSLLGAYRRDKCQDLRDISFKGNNLVL